MTSYTSQLTTLFVVVVLVCALVPAFSVVEGETKTLWDTCFLKITPKSALDIIGIVFGNRTITDVCCHDLVGEGKVCHDVLIKYISDRPHLVANETQYLKKRDDLWTHCVSVTKTA
ncbi:hypothetical protein EUTSA_v10002170mg [Eutrema salsugineum]|uniref:Prolamin-like domain-containing protein n=1 Tax=Eutrema salsugineum TaxID=72664 RepID=V4NU07_EUTSA|nr:uncharacterized protein LOC18025516 [Eutrema salsugineum]ESQ50211.1 hypothetical protein EUTSA_v10002170mg [Eutrema salsugineum]